MRFGIIGAMEQEIKSLAQIMKIEETQTIGMRQYYMGTLFGKDAVLVFSKYGKVSAASAVTTLIEIFKADIVIFTGVAGGADPVLNIGDIVVADKLVQHDMDTSALGGFKKFEIPLLGVDAFKVPDRLVSLAVQSARHYVTNNLSEDVSKADLEEFNISIPSVVVGTIASGDQFVADKNKVNSLCSEIDNLKGIEMEGAAVAQVCYEHSVEYVVFRVISDKADEHAVINFPKFVENAASHFTCGIIQRFVSEFH